MATHQVCAWVCIANFYWTLRGLAASLCSMTAWSCLGIVGVSCLFVGACSDEEKGPVSAAPEAQAGATTEGDTSSRGGSSAGTGGTASSSGAPASGESGSRPGGDTSDGPPNADGSIPTTVLWKVIAESADPNVYASTPAAASRGDDAAVVYIEQMDTTPATARVVIQRFDAAAERVGPLLELGTDPDPHGVVTLSSDGERYAACWDSSGSVHCSLLDDQNEAQRNVLALDGSSPVLVATPTGWLMAYAKTYALLRLQPLTPLLEPTGTAVDLDRSTHFEYPQAAPLLTPTPSGFALVGARFGDNQETLLRLGPDLQPLGPAIHLGRTFWFYGQVIASDTRAAVSLSAPYGSYLLLMDLEQVTAELLIAGGGKTGMDEALLVTEGGIGAAWLTGGHYEMRRFFADGADAQIGLGARPTQGPLGLPEEGTDSYQQLLTVGGQTLLVGRDRRYGYLGPAGIRAATLSFP